MTNNQIAETSMLDILFEHRNKDYGAYALRKYYNRRLFAATIIAVGFGLLVALFISPGVKEKQRKLFTSKEYILPTGNPLQPTPPQPPAPRVKARGGTPSAASARIVITPDVLTTVPEEDNNAGMGAGNDPQTDFTGAGDAPTGQSLPQQQTAIQQDAKTIVLSSSAARFPGGNEAFRKFLTRHLVTPSELEPGEMKTVLVRFMVSEDGIISRTEIVQSDGEEYEHEVKRVLAKMPKWIAAVQNGIKTASWFTQPVTFIGVEQ